MNEFWKGVLVMAVVIAVILAIICIAGVYNYNGGFY